MLSRDDAEYIIDRLRYGRPPQYGVREYSAGNKEFLEQIEKRHIRRIKGGHGKIRFISGSWGRGKTHFLSLIREMAFDSNYLVSFVRLNASETPFNRFEEVFCRIMREISSKEMYTPGHEEPNAPLGEVFRHQLFKNTSVPPNAEIDHETYDKACRELMGNSGIDIDFRRLVCEYWKTFRPGAGDSATLEGRRGTIMQWFSGEGTIGVYRKEFGVQKLINRSNARLLLNSLSRYAVHAGFNGIVVLLDEAEMSYSVMRKAELKKAHNNLLHLINSIEESPGLFFIYASTPDFYTDERHGIRVYGALAQRIGKPAERPPRALDRVWNLEYIRPELEDFQEAARKIRDLYLNAYPGSEQMISDVQSLNDYVRELSNRHARFAAVGFWRVLVKGVTDRFDMQMEGDEAPPALQHYDDIMGQLKED